ncbi:unnamed protein product [Nyctereutes procyonoides]|uniref:(raccoon dog) hypothetical protein n=1 Tax=Nyctereutes procyonoides TaxID=34880 RepID=A0A811XZ97_NYCPR|nr:unnamed protein product [Nyctereutes procyonoides]
MFYQLWEDSVNIKQPLARQTSFQMGTCTPGPPGQVSLPGVVGPVRGCCGCRICRRAGLGVATGPLQDTVQMRTHCPPLHPFLLRLAAWVGVGDKEIEAQNGEERTWPRSHSASDNPSPSQIVVSVCLVASWPSCESQLHGVGTSGSCSQMCV